MNETTGRLLEVTALLKFAADRTATIETDPEGEIELREIEVTLLNLARQIEDFRAYRI